MSKLLIVDDEERIRDIIKKYAQFEGFETVEAVDGLQAVEICRKEKPADLEIAPGHIVKCHLCDTGEKEGSK